MSHNDIEDIRDITDIEVSGSLFDLEGLRLKALRYG